MNNTKKNKIALTDVTTIQNSKEQQVTDHDKMKLKGTNTYIKHGL